MLKGKKKHKKPVLRHIIGGAIMKRTFVIAALTLCLFISSLSGLNAQAQEVEIDGDLLGGVFYTTLADDDIEDDITVTLSIN